MANSFNSSTWETESEGARLIQGHHQVYRTESVFKRNKSSHKGDPSTWETGEIGLCEERNIVRVETGAQSSLRIQSEMQSEDSV